MRKSSIFEIIIRFLVCFYSFIVIFAVENMTIMDEYVYLESIISVLYLALVTL